MGKELTVNTNTYGSVPLLGKISFRNYRDEDYEAVCGFLIELNRKERTHINWNWARLEWMIEHPEFDRSARSSIGLWWSGGKVVGAAIYDMYFGEAFCGALPESRYRTALFGFIMIRTMLMWSRYVRSRDIAGKELPLRFFQKHFPVQKR